MNIDTREVFGGKSFADLLKDIYDNSANKKKQIEILINELRPLILNVNEAAVIVPLIKDYLEVGVRNDEQLVKMASVFQKYAAAADRTDMFGKTTGNGGILTDREKEDLLREVAEEALKGEGIEDAQQEIEGDLDSLIIKAREVKKVEHESGDMSNVL